MLRRPALAVAAILSLATSFVHAQSNLDYVEKTLPNGMRVITVKDNAVPVVAVQVWYHVGSKDEDPKRQGFAHMFEHMMFRGTDRLGPKSHFELIRKVGGDNNAYTSFDHTTYVQKLPSNQLELALYLEAERMAFLKIDSDSFFTERAVVEEERRVGLNKPFGTMPEKLVAEIFKSHPYRWMPIGQIPHLRAASINELARFWETYYVPNNATLVLVGDLDHDKAQKLAADYFGWIPRGAEPPRVTEMEPAQTKMREITITDPKAPITLVGLGYRGPKLSSPDAVAIEVMTQIIGGESSALYQDLVKNKKIAVSAGAGAYALEQDGLVGVFAVLPPMGGSDEAKKKAFDALSAAVDKTRTTPPTAEELDKAKTVLLKNEVLQATTVEGKAQLVGTYAVLYDDLARVNKRFDLIRAVTAADVQKAAEKYFVEQSLNKVVVEPAGMGEMLKSMATPPSDGAAATKPAENTVAQRTGPKATAERPKNFPATAPIARLDPTFPVPKMSEKILSNGLKVVVVPDKRQPLVSMVLGLRFGSFSADNASVPGMAAELLTKGTKQHTSLQLADELEKNAISLGARVGADTGTVSANALTEKADLAAKLMAEVVLEPTFPADELDQAKTQALSNLKVSEQGPEYLAERELARHVWAGHPYARTNVTKASDIEAIKRDELPAWWDQFVRPDAAVLYIAGDLEPAAAFALAEKYFGGWKATGPLPVTAVSPTPEKEPMKIYLVDKPGSVQSQIRVGQVGLSRVSPDFPAAGVLTQIFGGSFNSRINESIRVKKGLTYGASGYFSARRFGGEFEISTFTKTDTTAETVKAILDEVETLKTAPITPAELDDSKTFLVGSFAGQRERPEAIINDLWLIEYTGLPADYLQQNLAAVARTSDADVLRVARDVIDPKHFVIVVVGDAKKTKASLEKIAPVEVVDPNNPTARPTTAPAK